MDELRLIRWLRSRLGRHPRDLRGIGDDAAVLRGFRGRAILTADMLLEGTHFRPTDPPAAVGWKALACSVSDIAAMAAVPLAATVSLGLRRGVTDRWIRGFVSGLARCARAFDCPIVGGDTTSGTGPVAIDVAVLGRASRPVLRSGARAGDAILVTGTLGGSILGKHLKFRPRLFEALSLARRFPVRAMMDVSDGLSLDLSRLCEESGVGAILEEAAIPVSAAARTLAAKDGASPLSHALSDGEDFELLFAMPEAAASRLLAKNPLGVRASRIGSIVRGRGLSLRLRNGRIVRLKPSGYVHRT